MCRVRPLKLDCHLIRVLGIELWSSARAVFTHNYRVISPALGLHPNSPGHISATNHTRNPETGTTICLLIPKGVKGPHDRELRGCY